MARALLKAREGDTVVLRTPGGTEELEVVVRALRAARHRRPASRHLTEVATASARRRIAWLTRLRCGPYSAVTMEDDLAALEAERRRADRVHARAADANEILRRELLALQERNRDLNGARGRRRRRGSTR